MFKVIEEGYSAEEAYEAGLKRRQENGADCSGIRLLVKTDNYVLSGNKDEDGQIYLAIHESSDAEDYGIKVYIDQDYKGRVEKAQVNWAAIGSVDADRATDFAKKISAAAAFARIIDGKDFSSKF